MFQIACKLTGRLRLRLFLSPSGYINLRVEWNDHGGEGNRGAIVVCTIAVPRVLA